MSNLTVRGGRLATASADSPAGIEQMFALPRRAAKANKLALRASDGSARPSSSERKPALAVPHSTCPALPSPAARVCSSAFASRTEPPKRAELVATKRAKPSFELPEELWHHVLLELRPGLLDFTRLWKATCGRGELAAALTRHTWQRMLATPEDCASDATRPWFQQFGRRLTDKPAAVRACVRQICLQPHRLNPLADEPVWQDADVLALATAAVGYKVLQTADALAAATAHCNKARLAWLAACSKPPVAEGRVGSPLPEFQSLRIRARNDLIATVNQQHRLLSCLLDIHRHAKGDLWLRQELMLPRWQALLATTKTSINRAGHAFRAAWDSREADYRLRSVPGHPWPVLGQRAAASLPFEGSEDPYVLHKSERVQDQQLVDVQSVYFCAVTALAKPETAEESIEPCAP